MSVRVFEKPKIWQEIVTLKDDFYGNFYKIDKMKKSVNFCFIAQLENFLLKKSDRLANDIPSNAMWAENSNICETSVAPEL